MRRHSGPNRAQAPPVRHGPIQRSVSRMRCSSSSSVFADFKYSSRRSSHEFSNQREIESKRLRSMTSPNPAMSITLPGRTALAMEFFGHEAKEVPGAGEALASIAAFPYCASGAHDPTFNCNSAATARRILPMRRRSLPDVCRVALMMQTLPRVQVLRRSSCRGLFCERLRRYTIALLEQAAEVRGRCKAALPGDLAGPFGTRRGLR
jgi:hypothetical protein